MKIFVRSALLVLVLFFFPALASIAVWSLGNHPGSWRSADWGSSGLLPPATADDRAAIYVLAARTGGLKGALSVHSWIVLKRPGGAYDRYDKVGWGLPVRKNAYAADGRWYSNEPFTVRSIEGQEAERLIPQIEAAIADYPAGNRDGYRIWPGPNSNSFIAHILRTVPEIDAALPPIAVGRNFVPGKFFSIDPDGRDFQISIYGLAGIAVGARSGFEVNLLGLVAGLNFRQPGIKLPGFGNIGL
jgi:Protein of unknown function (DUF3750)